jgi:lipoyl-dependent peroxiredoxin
VRTTGGRDGGSAHSADGRLDVEFLIPGGRRAGTNPEEMLAAAWSACFIGAMRLAAAKMKAPFPADVALSAEVDLCTADDGYFLRVRLNIRLPALEHSVTQALVDAAHQTCPYSKATRGNIRVTLNVV